LEDARRDAENFAAVLCGKNLLSME
jgi:hypothetical protein